MTYVVAMENATSTSPPYVKQGSQSLVVSTTWNTLFFWGDKPEGERREAGVDFAIKKDIVTKLAEMPRPVNERITTMKLPLSQDNFATIISVYAPTMTNPYEHKDAFFNQLAGVVSHQRVAVR